VFNALLTLIRPRCAIPCGILTQDISPPVEVVTRRLGVLCIRYKLYAAGRLRCPWNACQFRIPFFFKQWNRD
jgi:hypothetical protein